MKKIFKLKKNKDVFEKMVKGEKGLDEFLPLYFKKGQ